LATPKTTGGGGGKATWRRVNKAPVKNSVKGKESPGVARTDLKR